MMSARGSPSRPFRRSPDDPVTHMRGVAAFEPPEGFQFDGAESGRLEQARPLPSSTGTKCSSSSSSWPAARRACAAPAPWTSTGRSPAASRASTAHAVTSV